MSLPDPIQQAFDAKFTEIGEDAWHDLGNAKIFEFGWQAALANVIDFTSVTLDQHYSEDPLEYWVKLTHCITGVCVTCSSPVSYIEARRSAAIKLVQALASVDSSDQVVSESKKVWCEYIATMIGAYFNEPVDSDKCKAIAGIIERRLWAFPQRSEVTVGPGDRIVAEVIKGERMISEVVKVDRQTRLASQDWRKS